MDEEHIGEIDDNATTLTARIKEKCNQCEYATSQKYDLKIHLKIHSGEK